MRTDIDITFDFRRNTPEGKDPDTYSRTFHQYHRLLWSKPLPSGDVFRLDDARPRGYLQFRSTTGAELWLSSDAVIPTFNWASHIKELLPAHEFEAFNAIGYTIGGMMIFPGVQIDRQWTINHARGCTRGIRDRFDLTLECIRRHYAKGESPLSGVLARYGSFFNLFRDFRGYAEFFLLQDLVSVDFSAVQISEPFNDFKGSPVPASAREYDLYKSASIAFIEARNRRILASG